MGNNETPRSINDYKSVVKWWRNNLADPKGKEDKGFLTVWSSVGGKCQLLLAGKEKWLIDATKYDMKHCYPNTHNGIRF